MRYNMSALMVLSQEAIRFAAFVAVFAAMALWESAMPRRRRSFPRTARWPGNLAVAAINPLIEFYLLSVTPVGLAMLASARGWGLMRALSLPWTTAVVLTVVALDMVIYLQHVMFHAVPLLWRVHRMHHADLDFDVTTGLRFHPVEILVSLVIKLGAVAALGPPAAGVIAFEVALNTTSMFNHANVHIPERVDRLLRLLVVTPDMHRVHHSMLAPETNSNFGFNLPWWDRLFGTYRAQPRAGHEAMTIGLGQFREAVELRLDRMLWQPFRAGVGDYPIGHEETT
jgi:sterol desaturase/sphingolipid hydroxylase (fatty acid hydroxylase superfamily)